MGDTYNKEEILVELEYVFIRLSSASNKAQLEHFVDKNLSILFHHLSSVNDEVRSKSVEICTQLHKRLKNNPDVSLPVASLLEIYQNPDSNSFIKNFSLFYLKMGFPRLAIRSQIPLLEKLMFAARNKPENQKLSLFCMAVPMLGGLCDLDEENFKNLSVDIVDYSTFANFFDFLSQILQLPYFESGSVRVRRMLSMTGASQDGPTFNSGNSGHAEAMEVDDDDDDEHGHNADGSASFGVPGLSNSVYNHLMSDSFTKEFKTNPTLLEKVKIGIVKFLSKLNADLSNKTAYILIVASADSMHTVVDIAEGQMKKIIDRENKESVEKLFSVFLGTEKSKNVAIEERKCPCSLRLKLKVLTYFHRITAASKTFPQNIQTVFEGLFGPNTNFRLMQLSVDFGRSVAANLSGKTATVFGPLLLSGAERLVNEYDDDKLLCSGYRLMGDLGKVCSLTIVNDVGKVHKFFEELSKENEDVSSAIQDCLVSWSDIFMEYADVAHKKLLEALILAYADHNSSKCRLTSLKYIEKICSVQNVESRFALFVACGDSDELVRKEALRILRFEDISGLKSNDTYPSFDDAVYFCVQKINSKKVADSNVLPYKIDSMKEMVKYLNVCLEKTLMTEKVTNVLKGFVKKSIENRGVLEDCSIFDYFRLLLQLVDTYTNTEPLFLYTLRDLVVNCDDYFVDYMKEKLEFFENLALTSTKPDVCSVVCDLLSFSFCQITKNDEVFIEKLRSLTSTAHKAMDFVLGQCVLLAYLYYYAKSDLRLKYELDFKKAQEIFILRLNEREKSTNNLFLALFSLNIMLKKSSLTIDDDQTLDLIKFLLQMIQSRKDNMTIKLKEQAVSLSAWICVGRTKALFFETVLEGLSKVGEVPSDIELQIMVGEAFVVCCDCRRKKSDSGEFLSITETLSEERLQFLMNFLLKKIAVMENRHVKQALGSWLYILLDNFGDRQIVNDSLIEIQTVLLDCLAENNEFTQDTACRALAFVFQQAKESQKDALIISLLEKLNSPNAKDTLLPYQELCALATYIGNRQTIYMFMQLAVQHRKGEIKKSNISTDSYQILVNYFDKMIPFLYRATYDPSPNVQMTMKVVFSSLQAERTKSLVKEYSTQVMKYLVANLTNKSYRVRESCCGALSDILMSNSGDLASDYLADLWQILFRVCDDIKESVRLAASKCVLTLHKVTIKLCCPEPGVVKAKTLDSVLPVLLAGLESSVKEVNALSLVTLSVLSREAGSKLKPHLPVIMAALLDSLSTMEHQVINYLAVRASVQEADALDQARAAASKSSPMMDAVEYGVRFVDADVLTELVPKICSILQSSIGLATKTGCCRLINLLCVQCPTEIKTHSDKLLKSLIFHGLLDRNSTVKKHASASIGLLVKFCSETALKKLFSKVESWYLDDESGKSQSMCAYFLRAIANENPELLKSYGSMLIPIVFMAMNADSNVGAVAADGQTEIKQVWQEVWNEIGTEQAVKMYLDDILNFCLRIFSLSSNWNIKAQTLQTLSSIAEKYCSSMNDEKLITLINTLFSALQGRTWSGKEKILQTLSSLFEQSESRLVKMFSAVSIAELFGILMKECKKTNLKYRTSAIRCIGVFCKCFRYSDGFENLFTLLEPLLKKEKSLYDSDDEKSSSPKAGSKEYDEVNDFFTSSYTCLSRVCSVASENHADSLKNFADLSLAQLNICFWKIQLSILDCLCQILQNHQKFIDVKLLTLGVIYTYENASQTAVKDGCIEILRLSCVILLSCNVNLDVERLKIISNDKYCKDFYPDLVSVIDSLITSKHN